MLHGVGGVRGAIPAEGIEGVLIPCSITRHAV